MKPERLPAVFGRPRFRHERRAAGPLAAHADAEQQAEDRELPDVLREPARAVKTEYSSTLPISARVRPQPVGDHARTPVRRLRRRGA